ncbi:MAG: hypothetical protein ACXVZ4_07015 [Gaiellaceae bacterium]
MLLTAGCGGDGGKERYEQAMQRALSVVLVTTHPSAEMRAALRRQAARVATIEPPTRVASEHERLVAELRAAAAGHDESRRIEATLRAIERRGYVVVASFSDARD